MTQSFNPYSEWLGLAPNLNSPTDYQLLGLEPGTTNSALINQAADRQLAKVRGCRPGERATEWASLLDQIAAAKNRLAATSGPSPTPLTNATPSNEPQNNIVPQTALQAGQLPAGVSPQQHGSPQPAPHANGYQVPANNGFGGSSITPDQAAWHQQQAAPQPTVPQPAAPQPGRGAPSA